MAIAPPHTHSHLLTLRNVLVPVDGGEVKSGHVAWVIRSRQGSKGAGEGGGDVGLYRDLTEGGCGKEALQSHTVERTQHVFESPTL